MKKRFVAFLLVLIMVLGMLPVSALAADDGVSPQALNTGHKIDVTFTVLYVGDEFNIGYNYGTSEKTQFVCQYSTPHSDTAYNNHTIAISDIKAAADRASVNSGYQIVGWSKESNANPTVWPLNKTGTTACNKGTTIYLVAKDPNPQVTYTLNYHANGGDENSVPASQTEKSNTGKVTFTVSSKEPTRDGYKFLGWNGNPNDTTVTVKGGNTITTTAKVTNLYAVWESKTPPADKPVKPGEGDFEKAGLVSVECSTKPADHAKETYDLKKDTFTIGEVEGNATDGYTCEITVTADSYVSSYVATHGAHTLTGDNTKKFTLTWVSGKWVAKEGGVTFPVQCEQTPPPEIPGDQKPNIEEANAKIRVQCIEYPSKHNPYKQNYRILPGSYDDLGWDRTEYGYIYSIRLNRAKYIAQFDQEIGRPHTDTEPNEETRINWRWENGAWHLIDGPDGVTADIKVKCAETPVEPKKPTALDGSFAIVCKNNEATHAHKADYIATPSQYTISDVQTDEQGYYVTATVTVAPNLVAYNTITGAEHRLVNEQDATLTITFWSREGQLGTDVTGQTVNGWTNLVANWKVTPHNIYAYARLNSYFAPLTTKEFDTPITLNEATLSRLGLGSYNSLGYISIGSFDFDAMPLTEDLYFGDDAELSAVAEKLATDIALETGVSDKIAEKIAWTALYKTVNEEDMEPGYPTNDEEGYQLSGNLNLASVTFRAGAENVENMPAVNYTYDDGAIDFYDFYFAGDTFTMPADPTREGYIFEGWSVKVLPAENDADHLDADGADDAADETLLKAGDTYTITAGGVVFTAQWEARTDTPYTVEHYLENLDGSYALDTTEPLKGTTDTTVTAAAKSYDNFTYDSTVPGTVASGNIAGDGSLVLKLFYTRNTYDYTVRHIKQLPDGTYDEANAEVETLSGKFEALAAVTAKDYGSHYPTNDAGTKQNIKIEKNLTIDVKYDLDNHTLTFETNGGSAIDPVTVRHGNAVARPTDPTKDKYTFIGWYVDPEFTEEYDFATVLEADKTIYAKFELTSTPIGDIYVRYDVLHIKQLPDGSYDLANAEVEHLSAKKDTTVTAVVKDYSATHHINVNSTLSKLTDTAIQPYPGADGKPVYTILSVYYDLDFHTLTFDTMGGSRIDPVTVRHGNAVAKPKDPVNGGYIFDGWYTDKTYRTPYNFATVLTQDTTIYAKWFLIALPGVTIKKTTPKLNTSDHFAYVQGYPDGTVKPTGNITRAETAAILFRLMDEGSRKTYYSTKSGFRDVATGSWYNTYVATLNNAGVITDSSNGYFRPNEAITRAELAAMLANFTETAGAANYFNDVSASYWAANAIAICAKLGWITGYPDGSFRPDRNVTRAELMAMINRATGRAPKSADAFLPGMKTWSDNTADKWYYLDVQEATNSHSYTVKDSEKWTALNADPNWSLYE